MADVINGYLDLRILDRRKDTVEALIQKAEAEKAYSVSDGERFFRVRFKDGDTRNQELCITRSRLRQYLEMMLSP